MKLREKRSNWKSDSVSSFRKKPQLKPKRPETELIVRKLLDKQLSN